MNSALKLAISAFVFSGTISVIPQYAAASQNVLDGINTTCLESELKECNVTSSGFIKITEGPSLAFQIQDGYSEDTGTGAGVVIYEQTGDKWNLLTKDFFGVQYTLPRIIEGERILLHVPGLTAGTGAYNADILFEYVEATDGQASKWQKVDIENWRTSIEDFLPKGLGVWKGVAFDFGSWFEGDYMARTPLWQEDDANCCATGGSAIIHFTIENGVLKTSGVDYLAPKETAAQ